jgi:hypothetical protein
VLATISSLAGGCLIEWMNDIEFCQEVVYVQGDPSDIATSGAYDGDGIGPFC